MLVASPCDGTSARVNPIVKELLLLLYYLSKNRLQFNYPWSITFFRITPEVVRNLLARTSTHPVGLRILL